MAGLFFKDADQGADLVGMRYERLFDYLPVDADAFKVVAADFVSTESGTGIVHTAPAYGVDDLALGQQHNLPVVHAVGRDGCFLPQVEPVAGLFFKDADQPLIRILKERGLMFRSERYLHSYPFGWRTGDPIIYYAKNAWYIRTSDYKDRMVKLNQGINWVPETIRDGRFGTQLMPQVEPVAGLFFKDADQPLIRILKERGLMFRSERYLHSYPFGWRTGDPIIYYAKNAWYIRTSDYKDRMVKLNQGLNWVRIYHAFFA